MKVTVKVELDYDKLNRLETEAVQMALVATSEWLESEINAAQVVPHDTGTLEFSYGYEFIHDAVVSIFYSGPQARRLYYNPQFNFRQDKNPNAQGRWLDPWIFGDKRQDVVDAFALFYKEELERVLA